MNWKNSLLTVLAVLTINSCTRYSEPTIAIIQGTHFTNWDEQMDADFKRESHAHPDITFIFASEAKDDCEEALQIENAVASGVDAIVINPVSASSAIVPAIEKAYDSGVYVIIVGQKPNTYKYDAYLGVDNRKIGQMAASYVASKMGGEGNLMTVTPEDLDASFYTERKHAFMNTMEKFGGITITECPIRKWTSDSAHEAIDSIAALQGTVSPDMIFAFGDDLALGVIEASIWQGVPVMGVDGGLDSGLAEIQKGNLTASIMNPTRGEDAIATAVKIIKGRPYEKNDILVPEIIDADNVTVVLASLREAEHYKHRVDALNDQYGRMYPRLKTMTYILSLLAILLLILSVGVFFGVKVVKNGRNLSDRYLALQTDYEISEASRRALAEDKKGLVEALFDSAKDESSQKSSNPDESDFSNRFKNYIEENLGNADLSMDDIASSLNLSKAQMYRKVRAIFEMTPNEFLQTMRLSKADVLLKTSGLKIADVAYTVGFSSPSYFTKCYREKYGFPPKDKR